MKKRSYQHLAGRQMLRPLIIRYLGTGEQVQLVVQAQLEGHVQLVVQAQLEGHVQLVGQAQLEGHVQVVYSLSSIEYSVLALSCSDQVHTNWRWPGAVNHPLHPVCGPGGGVMGGGGGVSRPDHSGMVGGLPQPG